MYGLVHNAFTGLISSLIILSVSVCHSHICDTPGVGHMHSNLDIPQCKMQTQMSWH